ncbi:succinyl-diaminopimelate desuccinylase [Schaalia suimastitidis]|uniref:succinyl-diaminopimelate desuccinylase n=1 Tax=Schaalia suimastitidis TaxID=121163 RepID=UPI00055400DA|nr:succinyl-diaminopimelate desuccinylase [Schaalia suimastitidis]
MAARDVLALKDPVALTADLIDIPSVSGDEKRIADAVEAALRGGRHLEVLRDGDAVMARTKLGHGRRVIVAGHLDTVPIGDNIPHRRATVHGVDTLIGRGSVDMLGGVAAALYAALQVTEPTCDVTWIFYDHEEVDAALNGLGRLATRYPQWMEADFAVLCEPTNGLVEGGCNGTARICVSFSGVAAHTARPWRGDNAIHRMAAAIDAVAAYGNPDVYVDGLAYKESMSVVKVDGGVASNVVPDSARMWVNYRFAPSRTEAEAHARVARLVHRASGGGVELRIDDSAPGARPGLDSPQAAPFLRAVARAYGRGDGTLDGLVGPKYGWTDVARLSAQGVPAVNYGPGDPLLAHTQDEYVPTAQIRTCAHTLIDWLSSQ